MSDVPHGSDDPVAARRTLVHRALTCELTGELECAVALIRRLQQCSRAADSLAAGDGLRPPAP